jgi:hypothetical protein
MPENDNAIFFVKTGTKLSSSFSTSNVNKHMGYRS